MTNLMQAPRRAASATPDSAGQQTIRYAKKKKQPVVFIALTLIAVALTLPTVWLLITSLKGSNDVTGTEVQWWPETVHLDNFWLAVTRIPFFRYLGASLILSITSGVLSTVSSAAAGFAFARFSARGKRPLFGVLISLLMMPPIITLIPTFLLFAKVGMVGTYWPWVLWGLTGSPYLIFLFRQVFSALPKELEEAAILDGASYFRIFWQIFLPLSTPMVVTAFVLTFNGTWADFIAPSLLLNNENTTLAVAIAGGYTNEMGFPLNNLVAAGAILYVLPMIILFLLVQKTFVRGMATAGLK